MIHNEHIEYFYNDFCQQKILVYINHSIQYKECTFQQTYHVLHPLKFLKLENRGYKSSLQKKKKKNWSRINESISYYRKLNKRFFLLIFSVLKDVK